MDKRDWLRRNLRCVCGATLASEWSCDACGADYPVFNRSVSFIDEALAAETRVNAENPVAAHAYNPTALALLDAVKAQDGMALDCGAGSRDYTNDHLVQTEIRPYDNIDVLAVNQRLPFADASFDLVLSFDVLEHVTDPFASAAELARVLKPGGVLFLDLPFLQTEHGYPHHYFNATIEGARQLFAGHLRCEAQWIPNAGHPSVVVHQMLNAFQGGLTKQQRPEFCDLTVRDIFEGGPAFLRERFPNFREEKKRQMAGTTEGLFVKPGLGEGNRLAVDLETLPSLRAYAKS